MATYNRPYNANYYTDKSRFLRNVDVAEFSFGAIIPLVTDKVKFDKQDIALYYTVPPNFAGRIDLISNDLYGSPDLFWAICEANNINDLVGYPEAGEVLSIPSLSAVRRYL